MEREVLWKAEDVAAVIRLPRASVYELVRSGTLPVVRIGRLVRFSPDQIARWISTGGKAQPVGE